jgi:hypothetical protein
MPVINGRKSAMQLGADSATLAFLSAVEAGSTLFCCTVVANTNGSTLAVSDGLNGSWGSPAVSKALTGATSLQVYIHYFPNTVGGTPTVTVNPGGASADAFWFVIGEIDDADAAPLDKTASAEDTVAGPNASVSTGVLTQNDEVVIAVMAHNGVDDTPINEDTGDAFTLLAEDEDNSPGQAGSAQYKIVSTTASIQVDWFLEINAPWIAAVATFKLELAPEVAQVYPFAITQRVG